MEAHVGKALPQPRPGEPDLLQTRRDERLFGGPRDDYLFGARGRDSLFGRGGDDVLLLADPAPRVLLHVDGARLANAAASLNANLKSITADAGVDVLSFGGTKNGMIYGEAVVFFDPELAQDFKFIRKQGMHLPSKMRFISAQFEALLSGNLWHRSAAHANSMARLLASELEKVPGGKITLTQAVEANGVFAVIPKQFVPQLQKKYFFYVWNEAMSEVRLMCSFDTTEEDIHDFVAVVRRIVR